MYVFDVMVCEVVRRDGSLEPSDRDRIMNAILGAMREIGGPDYEKASQITEWVVRILVERVRALMSRR